MKLLLMTLLLSGCGRGSSIVPDWIIQDAPTAPVKREKPVESIEKILNEFLFDCGETYGADVSAVSKLESVRYGDPKTENEPNRVGVCWQWTDPKGRLAKSKIEVKQLNQPFKDKGLLYHEFGHCILGLDHNDEKLYTMMSPSLLSESYYEDHWDELVEGLCLKRKD